jgi:hypothetical protein
MNLKIINRSALSILLGVMIIAGCGKQNPVAPVTATKTTPIKSIQTFKPAGVIYSGVLGGTPGVKPWYWFDYQDNSDFNAKVITNGNAQSANITLQSAGWGKVSTFAISYANTGNATVNLRIFVPSHSASVTWKILIQEQNGQWRNWVLQDSTGYTGYKDYDLTSILTAVNAGSGSFTIVPVVEGAAGQYIEVSELYVYLPSVAPAADDLYWVEWFNLKPGASGNHTPGWFDETTNPGFRATVCNTYLAGTISGDVLNGGKVESPVIPWNAARCQHLFIGMSFAYSNCYSVWIQEQTGQYRQWKLPQTYNYGLDGIGGFTSDMSVVTGLADGTPFSITISDVFGKIYIVKGIKLY